MVRRTSADPCRERLWFHRLDDVVIGACLEAGHEIMGVVLCGDHDDRHVAVFAKRPADVESAHVRQSDVQEHNVDAVPGEEFEPATTVDCLNGLMTFLAHSGGQRDPDVVVVFDQQQHAH